jgi:hypothetical protein
MANFVMVCLCRLGLPFHKMCKLQSVISSSLHIKAMPMVNFILVCVCWIVPASRKIGELQSIISNFLQMKTS